MSPRTTTAAARLTAAEMRHREDSAAAAALESVAAVYQYYYPNIAKDLRKRARHIRNLADHRLRRAQERAGDPEPRRDTAGHWAYKPYKVGDYVRPGIAHILAADPDVHGQHPTLCGRHLRDVDAVIGPPATTPEPPPTWEHHCRKCVKAWHAPTSELVATG